MGQIRIEQGDIVLLPVVLSDFSKQKIRPAVVISSNKYNANHEDIIICSVSSSLKKSRYRLNIDAKYLKEGTLFLKSQAIIDSVHKVSKNLIIRKVAATNKAFHKKIQGIVKELIS